MIKKLIKNRMVITVCRKLFPFNPENRYVNLGGGNWYYPRWENIDLKADKLFVDYRMDLNKKELLPFLDSTVKILFTQNVIYYLERKSVQYLFRECYRVLKTGGLFHVSITDDDTKIGREVQDILSGVKTRFTCFLLRKMLTDAGFKNVQEVPYRKSSVRVLRGILFDRVPDRNFYMEARK